MIVDFHIHVFPDDLAERAVKTVMSMGGSDEVGYDGTVSGLIESMERSGVNFSVSVPVSTKPSQVESINNWAVEQSQRGLPVIFFGAMHPDYPEPVKEIKRLKRSGIQGIKMHPEYQSFYPDDERVFRIYEALLGEDMVLVMHAGWDDAFPDAVHGTPERFVKILRKFPNLKLVLAHFGGYKMWDRVVEVFKNSEIKPFVDTSYSAGKITRDQALKVIETVGIDRVVFGSDGPWMSQKKNIRFIESLGLESEDLEMIMWKNAVKLVDLGDGI